MSLECLESKDGEGECRLVVAVPKPYFCVLLYVPKAEPGFGLDTEGGGDFRLLREEAEGERDLGEWVRGFGFGETLGVDSDLVNGDDVPNSSGERVPA